MRSVVFRFFQFVCASLLFSLGLVSPLLAKDGNPPKLDVEARLEELRQQVESQSEKLSMSESKIRALETTLEKQRAEVADVRREEGNLSAQLDKVSSKLGEVRTSIQETAERVDRVEEVSAKRIKALYMNRSAGMMDKLVLPKTADGFFRSTYYISKVRSFDRDTLTELRHLKAKYEQQEKVFEELSSEHARILKGISGRRAKLTKALNQREASVQKLKIEQVKSEKILLALQAQALRLETVVASLTGDDSVEVEPSESRTEVRELGEDIHYEGEGLRSAKGYLVLPVQSGKVVRKFGKQRHGQFADMLFSKGIEYSLPEGDPVQAIAPGRVMFRGRMPGYDRIVILDHGKRHYSLYGRLHDFAVNVGDIVKKSDSIGVVGALDDKGRNFYFEIRKRGTPVNPKEFFGQRLTP